MILFINACARAESRTKQLAKALLQVLDEYVTEIELYKTEIPLLDETNIRTRQEAAEKHDEANTFVKLATTFSDANTIVIAAPYWDLSYPAVLRSYIEAVQVQGITFDYEENGKPTGLCKAREIYYVTTSGGEMGEVDLGFEHIKALGTQMWGIDNIHYIDAHGLDIAGNDPNEILNKKIEQIRIMKSDAYQTISLRNRVMIVDDSKINIIKAEHVLKQNGFFTITATSGEECIKKLKVEEVNLILLDIAMPDMDGFETLEAIRADDDIKDIPVIFVTADNSMEDVIRASKLGISGYVTKPFDDAQLIEHVRKTLATS